MFAFSCSVFFGLSCSIHYSNDPPRPHKKGFSGLKITKDAMFSTSLFSLAILLFKIFSTLNS